MRGGENGIVVVVVVVIPFPLLPFIVYVVGRGGDRMLDDLDRCCCCCCCCCWWWCAAMTAAAVALVGNEPSGKEEEEKEESRVPRGVHRMSRYDPLGVIITVGVVVAEGGAAVEAAAGVLLLLIGCSIEDGGLNARLRAELGCLELGIGRPLPAGGALVFF